MYFRCISTKKQLKGGTYQYPNLTVGKAYLGQIILKSSCSKGDELLIVVTNDDDNIEMYPTCLFKMLDAHKRMFFLD